jgi:hypothetical protein
LFNIQSKIRRLEASTNDQAQFMKEVMDHSSKNSDNQYSGSISRTSVIPELDTGISSYRASTAPSEFKSPLGGEESSTEIIFIKNDSGHVSVKHATLPKLVERLLNPMVHGIVFSNDR